MNKTERNWISRMLRTFIQTAIGCLAVGIPTVNFNDGWDIIKKSLIGIAITAIASGLAAAMNIYDEKDKSKDDVESLSNEDNSNETSEVETSDVETSNEDENVSEELSEDVSEDENSDVDNIDVE